MHIDGAAVLLGFMVVDTEYDECEIAHESAPCTRRSIRHEQSPKPRASARKECISSGFQRCIGAQTGVRIIELPINCFNQIQSSPKSTRPPFTLRRLQRSLLLLIIRILHKSRNMLRHFNLVVWTRNRLPDRLIHRQHTRPRRIHQTLIL